MMKVIPLIFVMMLFSLPAAVALGQKPGQVDGPIGIFGSRTEYDQFMGSAKRAAYGDGGNTELQAMIPMLNDIVLNQPIGSTASQYNGTASPLGLLSDSKIRAEIEMVDDQYKDLQELESEVKARAARQLRELDFSDRDNLVKQIREIQDGAAADISGVLLPHQLDRLRQIGMQSQLRRRSLVEVLTSDPLKSDLKITDRQSEFLREEETKIQADLEKEIAKLRRDAQDRLLSRLNPSQKEEVESMIGSAFEFSQRPRKDSRNRKMGTRRGKK